MLFIFVLLFFHSFFFHSLLSVRSIFLPIHPFVFFTPYQCDVHLHAHFPPLTRDGQSGNRQRFNVVPLSPSPSRSHTLHLCTHANTSICTTYTTHACTHMWGWVCVAPLTYHVTPCFTPTPFSFPSPFAPSPPVLHYGEGSAV